MQVDLEEIRWKKSSSNNSSNHSNNQSQLMSSTNSSILPSSSTSILSTSNSFSAESTITNASSMSTAVKSTPLGPFADESKSGILMDVTSPLTSLTNQNNNNSHLPARDVKVQVGSLSVRNLGSSHLSALSDTPPAIMPVSLKTSRLDYWTSPLLNH